MRFLKTWYSVVYKVAKDPRNARLYVLGGLGRLP